MSALDTLERIASLPCLAEAGFRYCLAGADKVPYKADGSRARPNADEDFCSLEELSLCESLEDFAGIGISVKASKVCAVDVDKCFSVPFDARTGDDRAYDVINIFAGKAYIEFSFSGKGLRVLLFAPDIADYSRKYYVKNDKRQIEYYQPSGSARYVTLTGRPISYCKLAKTDDASTLLSFLDKYMTRPKLSAKEPFTCETEEEEELSLDELMKKARYLYLTDIAFQDAWFAEAPGSGSNESQLDYKLASLIYSKITRSKQGIFMLFEASPYFKSKDWKHIQKWNYNNHRYFNYIYDHLGDRL